MMSVLALAFAISLLDRLRYSISGIDQIFIYEAF